MHLDQTTEQNSSELKTQKEVTNITMETVDMVTATYLYTTDTYDTSTTADTNPNVTNPPNHVTCGPVSNLYRTEDMKTPDYAVYSLGPQSVDEVLIVSPHQVSLVQFDVVPIKDSGGTLLYSAKLSQVAINVSINSEGGGEGGWGGGEWRWVWGGEWRWGVKSGGFRGGNGGVCGGLMEVDVGGGGGWGVSGGGCGG